MTRRAGSGLLAVGIVGAAWLVGSTALAVLGVGLCLAFLVARGWVALVSRALSVERTPLAAAPVEGEALRLETRVRGRRFLAARVEWRDQLGLLGEREATVAADGRARITVDAVPRGRYALGPGSLVVDDPLGLKRLELGVRAGGSILVRPRVPELHTLFTDTGTWGEGGRRANVRRPSGLEPHGVRDYVEGEPLRAVHWPTSARRGVLMVRELEDAPRDSVAIVLDVDAASQAGLRGASSLDDGVRAAAGLARAYAARSRRALLVIASPAPVRLRVHGLGRDWEEILDALAAVEPVVGAPLAELVGPRGTASSAPELVVVTARPEIVVNALLAHASGGRTGALVSVDAPTYDGREPTLPSPGLLRLGAAGIAVATVRRGDTLVEVLGAFHAGRTAVG